MVFGICLCDIVSSLSYSDIVSKYPRSDYLKIGERINKGKTYNEIKSTNYAYMFPNLKKFAYVFTIDTLFTILLMGGTCYMIFVGIGNLASIIANKISDEHITVLTPYRYATTASLYAFLCVISKWVAVNTYFQGIINEVRGDALTESMKT